MQGRRLAGAGALAALAVAVVFATVGDGVDVMADGAAGAVLDYGHTLTWLLIAGGLGLHAVRRGPRWAPRALGLAGLGCYLLFLLTLLTAGD